MLDFAGPGEVFTHAPAATGEAGFNVYTVAASPEPLVSQGFLTIRPQYSFENAPKPDIVVFPGGQVNGFLADKAGMKWTKDVAQDAEITMSVCNGAACPKSALLLISLCYLCVLGASVVEFYLRITPPQRHGGH